jgi:hypothetical protein
MPFKPTLYVKCPSSRLVLVFGYTRFLIHLLQGNALESLFALGKVHLPSPPNLDQIDTISPILTGQLQSGTFMLSV